MVPLPESPLTVPSVALMSASVKLVMASLAVKVSVDVPPDDTDDVLAVIAIVGGIPSAGLTALDASDVDGDPLEKVAVTVNV